MYYLRCFSLTLFLFNRWDHWTGEERRCAEWNNRRRWNGSWLIDIPCKHWLSTSPSSTVCFLSMCPHLSQEITQTTCSGEASVRWGTSIYLELQKRRTISRGFLPASPLSRRHLSFFYFIADSSELKCSGGSRQGTRRCRPTQILPVRSQIA